MFDVGFSELLVIAVVALIVIGPERLPKVARTLGHLLGRMQRYVNEVKADINREMQLDELKKLQHEVHDSMKSFENTLQKEIRGTQEKFEEAVQPVRELLAETSENETDHAKPGAEVSQDISPHLEETGAPAALSEK